MIKPFIPHKLFEVNENFDVKFENDIIIIDNYYKNYNDILEVLYNMNVPIWKWSDNGRNFKDYYDCRPTIQNEIKSESEIINLRNIFKLILQYYNEKEMLYEVYHNIYEFNYLKHIKNIPNNNYQFYPHIDFPYASIIYLDEVCSGGTAFYKEMKNIENLEHQNLFYDVSNLDKTVVEAKPNRHIIFKGSEYHGGYIEDHNKYINDWRINQVRFYNYV